MTSTGPLEGITAVEFSEHAFVPASAAVLAEWGADVIKIERRSGDHLRHLPIRAPDGTDYLFEHFNRNKRGIALDVEAPQGREIFAALVSRSDVFITNHLPRVQRRLGDRPEDIFALNPRIVYARGSGQGKHGPDSERGGNDNVSFWSRAGVGYMLSSPDADDIIGQRAAIGDGPTGIALAAGILAALIQVARTGVGVEVNTSLFHNGLWTLSPDITLASTTGVEPERRRPDSSLSGPLSTHYHSADGRRIALSMTNEPRYWPLACAALGLDHLVDTHPTPADRAAHRSDLVATFRTTIASMNADELDRRLRDHDCVYAFVNNPAQVLDDPSALANGYFVSHPSHPTLRMPSVPAIFDDQAPTMRRRAPTIGEHTREILHELGYDDATIAALHDTGVVGPEAR